MDQSDDIYCPICNKKRPNSEDVRDVGEQEFARIMSSYDPCCNSNCKGHWGTGCWHCHHPSFLDSISDEYLFDAAFSERENKTVKENLEQALRSRDFKDIEIGCTWSIRNNGNGFDRYFYLEGFRPKGHFDPGAKKYADMLSVKREALVQCADSIRDTLEEITDKIEGIDQEMLSFGYVIHNGIPNKVKK